MSDLSAFLIILLCVEWAGFQIILLVLAYKRINAARKFRDNIIEKLEK